MGFLQIRQKQKTCGKEIQFACDFCSIHYVRSYKKRLLTTKTGFFCSTKCAGHWKLENGITSINLFSLKNRKKAQKNIKKTYTQNKTEILKKIQATWKAKWGVDNISQSSEIKSRKKETTFKNFGVTHHMRNETIKNKVIVSQLKNRTCWVSNIETQFGKKLQDFYGSGEVVPQIHMPCGVIDFYVKPIDKFIEFDGVYWHGLDRSIQKILASKNPRDKSIAKKMKKDQLTNRWFVENNKTLCRITDVQFKTLDFDRIIEKIERIE